MRAALLALLTARVLLAADELPPLSCHDARCQYLGKFQFDEHRYRVDDNELWVMHPGIYFRIKCIGPSVLKSPAMPRANFAFNVWDVNIARCELPAGSLVDQLAEMNVTMVFNENENEPRGNLTLEGFPSSSLLTSKLFAGLERLVSLHIYSEADAQMTAEPHFLSPLKNLRSLRLQYVTLPDGEMDAPRPLLHRLILLNTGIQRLPKAVYSSTSLLILRIESDVALDAVALPSGLKSLELQSPATTLRLDTVPALEELYLTHWTTIQPPPLTQCNSLRKLHLEAPALHTLPHGWLANCSSLVNLVIENAQNLTTLPQRLFGSCVLNLDLIAFKNGALETLAEGQFDNATCFLSTLQLNGNRLRTIPSGTLPSSLETLDLSSNNLDVGVLNVVKSVRYRIIELNLANNPRLSDVCDDKGFSPLYRMTTLKRLFLSKTNVTRICRDWRENLYHLQKLDLSQTSVSTLSFEDLQFRRIEQAEVLLHASVTSIQMTRDDFNKVKRRSTGLASVLIETELTCDCRMYWTRRLLDRSPFMLDHIKELRCAGGVLLHELPPEDMVCARPAECAAWALPAACACAARPDDDPQRSRQLVRVRCERAALLHLPRLPTAEGRLYELLLPYNRITDLHAADLHHVKGLDLRDNLIRAVDEETASKLGRLEGVLRLAGNPLACDCSAAPLLQALRSRALGSTDLKNGTCSDGKPLDDAFVVGCPPSVAWLAGGFAALFLLAVAIIAYLASRERRFFLKAVLHRWGCMWFGAADEEERRYDAFVTFSHKDEGVVRELVARLEPPYWLCLHYRDWTPGLRIPDQIVDSVHESYRTLALVSRHFLSSTWTRAEFREAHAAAMLDARPRLIVILLEEPAALQMDEQLQRYIATHTYLRWGDPWFWDKLAVALPRPRPRPRPPADVVDHTPSISHASPPSSNPRTLTAPTVLTLPPAIKLKVKRQLPGSSSAASINSESATELALRADRSGGGLGSDSGGIRGLEPV